MNVCKDCQWRVDYVNKAYLESLKAILLQILPLLFFVAVAHSTILNKNLATSMVIFGFAVVCGIRVLHEIYTRERYLKELPEDLKYADKHGEFHDKQLLLLRMIIKKSRCDIVHIPIIFTIVFISIYYYEIIMDKIYLLPVTAFVIALSILGSIISRDEMLNDLVREFNRRWHPYES